MLSLRIRWISVCSCAGCWRVGCIWIVLHLLLDGLVLCVRGTCRCILVWCNVLMLLMHLVCHKILLLWFILSNGSTSRSVIFVLICLVISITGFTDITWTSCSVVSVTGFAHIPCFSVFITSTGVLKSRVFIVSASVTSSVISHTLSAGISWTSCSVVSVTGFAHIPCVSVFITSTGLLRSRVFGVSASVTSSVISHTLSAGIS